MAYTVTGPAHNTHHTCRLFSCTQIAGHKTGFGNPTWLETHPVATTTAPPVAALLAAGATVVGKAHMSEMAYSLDGSNVHTGPPLNAAAPGRNTGGSSSGSAVRVAVCGHTQPAGWGLRGARLAKSWFCAPPLQQQPVHLCRGLLTALTSPAPLLPSPTACPHCRLPACRSAHVCAALGSRQQWRRARLTLDWAATPAAPSACRPPTVACLASGQHGAACHLSMPARWRPHMTQPAGEPLSLTTTIVHACPPSPPKASLQTQRTDPSGCDALLHVFLHALLHFFCTAPPPSRRLQMYAG